MPQNISEWLRSRLFIHQMTVEKFSLLLSAFGRLPEDGKRELVERMAGAVGTYRFRIDAEKTLPQPAKQRELLESISGAASRLLKRMGFSDAQVVDIARHRRVMTSDPATSLLLVQLYAVGTERRPATATPDADELFATLVLLLSDLAEAAKRSARKVSEQSPRRGKARGKGGKSRAGPIAAGELIGRIIETYATMRKRFPKSGPPLSYDHSLRQFVRAGLALADPDLSKPSLKTDEAIRGVLNRWQAQSKAKQAVI
jgi:hypothetical protein